MLVSIVIPARQWDAHLVSTLDSIRDQQLPDGVTVETIVGLATGTRSDAPPDVCVIPNPSGTIPDALNLATGVATGAIVVRVDARCRLQPDHVSRTIERLADPEVGCVGGAQLVLDRGVFGSAYALAFNSPMLGPSAYRYRSRSGPVDTAYLGAWRRADLLELGGFDPRLIRNQDNELADRVRSSGRTVFYDAELVVGYTNGRTLRSTMAHHHEFGMWRQIQAGHGQRALAPRQIAAVAAAASGALLTVGALASPATRRPAIAAIAAAYLGATVFAHRSAARLRAARPDIPGPGFHPVGVAAAPAVAAIIDVAWAAGLVRGAKINRTPRARPDKPRNSPATTGGVKPGGRSTMP